MFRRAYNLCQIDTNVIRDIRKYTLTQTWQTHILMNPFVEEEEKKEVKSKSKEKLNPIIKCKRKEFDFYPGTVYKKFDTIEIASKGWQHYKSKGDYFTINPIIKEESDADELEDNCKFDDFDLHPQLIENLKKNGIEKPTTIQKLGIPEILNGQNTIITSETGCGKTLTYLLPIINQIIKWKPAITDRPPNSPLAVVITPSRELTLQIAWEAKKYVHGLDIDIKTLTGGRTKKIMRNPPVRNVDILIGSLGVTTKLTSVKIYKMNYVYFTVVDEAHALFDETFDDKMKVFLRRINFGFKRGTKEVPQTSSLTFTSATMPNQLPEYLHKIINIESLKTVSTTNCHHVLVPQKFLRLNETEKPAALLKLIKPRAAKKIPTIVFCNDGKTSDWVSIFLNQFDVTTVSLNGQMGVVFRKDNFVKFQNGEVSVLSTTNAGARGLDTGAVDCVINYDFPLNTADYVHRCGRTGRVGGAANGRVINFVTKRLEIELVQKIERATRRNRPLPMFDIQQQQKEKLMDDELKSLMDVAKTM